MRSHALVLALCLGAGPIGGQAIVTERMLCDPADPANRCPGLECDCSEDSLEVVFDHTGSSVIIVDEPSQGISVPTSIVFETKSSEIQGWSYGVAHDKGRLSLETATFEGTDAAKHFIGGGFHSLALDDVHTCLAGDAKCMQAEEGGGYVHAMVQLFDGGPGPLPAGRSSLSRARYKVLEEVAGADPPLVISLSERLQRTGYPPTRIHFTHRGRSIQPRRLSDGWIVSSASRPFRRGDPDGDGRSSVADAISVLLFLFLSGPTPGCLEAADIDDDGRIDAADPISLLRWLFLQGPPPREPGPPSLPCGRDREDSPADLGCAVYGAC
jgi:hypothetical protein